MSNQQLSAKAGQLQRLQHKPGGMSVGYISRGQAGSPRSVNSFGRPIATLR